MYIHWRGPLLYVWIDAEKLAEIFNTTISNLNNYLSILRLSPKGIQ
jgi:hypothetical protein